MAHSRNAPKHIQNHIQACISFLARFSIFFSMLFNPISKIQHMMMQLIFQQPFFFQLLKFIKSK